MAMTERADTQLLGVGVYTVPQAARLAHVPIASVRRWLFGYRYAYKGSVVERPAVVTADPTQRGDRVVCFRDLIEIQFVHAFRDAGVSWPTIRLAAEKAREITRLDHPFASREFVTDGRTIFAQIVQATGNKELLDLKSDQMAFRRVLLPTLRAQLEVGDSGVERIWPMGKRRPIVIDPKRQFGQPIVRDEGVPTEVLAGAYQAMRSLKAVASWYCVSVAGARAAVEFEKNLVA